MRSICCDDIGYTKPPDSHCTNPVLPLGASHRFRSGRVRFRVRHRANGMLLSPIYPPHRTRISISIFPPSTILQIPSTSSVQVSKLRCTGSTRVTGTVQQHSTGRSVLRIASSCTWHTGSATVSSTATCVSDPATMQGLCCALSSYLASQPLPHLQVTCTFVSYRTCQRAKYSTHRRTRIHSHPHPIQKIRRRITSSKVRLATLRLRHVMSARQNLREPLPNPAASCSVLLMAFCPIQP
ncbi:hypothetical protein V8C43DRAFT_277953, partial [Trichoderma afarasin]